jgi:hypothetical protein
VQGTRLGLPRGGTALEREVSGHFGKASVPLQSRSNVSLLNIGLQPEA